MSNLPGPGNLNPYESPQAQTFAPSISVDDLATTKLIKEFRSQSLALGVLWTFFGAVGLGLMIFLISSQRMDAANSPTLRYVLVGVLGVVGALWMVAGVGTLQRQIWAVWLGLVMSYLSIVGNLLNMNICALVVAGVAILQGHRVIGFANQMRQKGIPLTQKP